MMLTRNIKPGYSIAACMLQWVVGIYACIRVLVGFPDGIVNTCVLCLRMVTILFPLLIAVAAQYASLIITIIQ